MSNGEKIPGLMVKNPRTDGEKIPGLMVKKSQD
jgi:hypothetical protein